jgi:mRNA interferase MazF
MDLSADEMKAVDKAISLSLGINHHYHTLQNMYTINYNILKN